MEPMICTQPASPKFDSLPTYKITDYPLEKRDYKPFAQAQVCLTPTELVLRLWAFEAHPRPGSTLEAVFTTRQSQELLTVRAKAEGEWSCRLRSPKGERKIDALAHAMGGEDLQGVFWGISIAIRRELVENALGKGCLQTGGVLYGNFYKLGTDPQKSHRGSCFPADFAQNREYALGSLAPFAVVNY